MNFGISLYHEKLGGNDEMLHTSALYKQVVYSLANGGDAYRILGEIINSHDRLINDYAECLKNKPVQYTIRARDKDDML